MTGRGEGREAHRDSRRSRSGSGSRPASPQRRRAGASRTSPPGPARAARCLAGPGATHAAADGGT
eukprot:scaffold572_cov223-Prasinococcus_capsulatus_cf.AAC.1